MLMWQDACSSPGVLLMRSTNAYMNQSFSSGMQQSQGPFCDQSSQVGLLWSLQRNFPRPAMPWLGLMLVITGVGISWVFSTSHLKYHQLISFFVLLAIFKLQFYILVSDKLWESRQGAMRTPQGGCLYRLSVFLQPGLPSHPFIHNFQVQQSLKWVLEDIAQLI